MTTAIVMAVLSALGYMAYLRSKNRSLESDASLSKANQSSAVIDTKIEAGKEAIKRVDQDLEKEKAESKTESAEDFWKKRLK